MDGPASIDPLPSAEVYRRELGVDEIRSQTVRLAIVGILVLVLSALFLSVFDLKYVPPLLLLLTGGMLLVTWVAYLVSRRRSNDGATVFIVGLLGLLTIAVRIVPSAALTPWFALVVLLAGALLGARAGALVAVIVTGVLVGLAEWPTPEVRLASAFSAGLLSWAALFAYWLISRPTNTALAWAWNSYVQARDQTARARERQAELARLSKGLGESNYQLEQLNLELERARRAEREARRLKAEFAAAVSHELRTPLNLIIGFCEMMVLSPSSAYGERLPVGYQHDLESIYRNAGHIAALVDDILDLGQIDANRMALHRDWASLRRIVDEAVGAVETLFQDRDLEVRVVIDELPPVWVDQTRVRQILINLLSNAARFIEEGGATIRAERHEDAVVVSVADTGLGIRPDELSYVFEEFFQVRAGRGRRSGSGLGLTISKRFAELHGGTMWVESAGVGQGSTFFLKLPIEGNAPEIPRDAPDWEDRLSSRVHGQADSRVLVVDPVGDLHRVFQRYLDGFQVLHAPSARECHRHARTGGIQAVVVGSAAARPDWPDAQQLPPNLREVPIISCSLRATHRVGQELGAASYLVKPVTRDQFRAALRRLERPARSALIVDDDAEMTRLLSRMFKSLVRGGQCWIAQDGRLALDLLRAHHPDLLLLDLLMPDVTGYDVLDAMRGDPALGQTPVFIVSARGLGDESIVADGIGVTRAGGLTVAEIMRWVRSGLQASSEASDSAGGWPAAPTATPASGETGRPPERARASAPEAPSR
ncbi:MAG TPA: ATP-binding protein [Chloroflexota bacterium]|nr:ATP-binding protein [Chloroflexota bacterium]